MSFDDNPLGYLLILSDELHEADRPRCRPWTDPGVPDRGFTDYELSPITSVRVTTDAASPPRLTITYDVPPGTTRIGRDTLATWRSNKQDCLRDSLALGPTEPFADIDVACP